MIDVHDHSTKKYMHHDQDEVHLLSVPHRWYTCIDPLCLHDSPPFSKLCLASWSNTPNFVLPSICPVRRVAPDRPGTHVLSVGATVVHTSLVYLLALVHTLRKPRALSLVHIRVLYVSTAREDCEQTAARAKSANSPSVARITSLMLASHLSKSLC